MVPRSHAPPPRRGPLRLAPALLVLCAAACSPCGDSPGSGGSSGARSMEQLELEQMGEDDLRQLPLQELWGLGRRKLDWEGEAPPVDVTRDELVDWFLTDRAFRDLGDFEYIEAPGEASEQR